MKLNRKHLRKMILQEMKNEVPPHLRVDDAFPPKLPKSFAGAGSAVVETGLN